jgi:transposase-like protein
MRDPAFTTRLTGTVEADETYIGGKRRKVPGKSMGRPGPSDKNKAAVLALVERDGRARSFHVARVDAAHLRGAIREHVERDAAIMTDEWRSYMGLGREFASHETVSHGEGEYVRGAVHTNTVEGYFATLKRGVNGTYHRISPAHLHRYLNEFDFRYSTRGQSDGLPHGRRAQPGRRQAAQVPQHRWLERRARFVIPACSGKFFEPSAQLS